MNWAAVAAVLEKQISQMNDVIEGGRAGKIVETDNPAALKRQLLEQVLRDVGEFSDAADEACEYFAKHQAFPMLEERLVWVVFRRVVFAKEVVDFVAYRPDKVSGTLDQLPDGYTVETMLRYLLVDFWHIAGPRRWFGELLDT